jgi:DNA-binding NarL/FixJ family response regulator
MTIRLMLAGDHRMPVRSRAPMREQASTSWARPATALKPSDGGACVPTYAMDVAMPEMDGVEATRQIRASLPNIRIVMLTMHADQEVLAAAIRAGASGYLVKDCSTAEIAAAVRMAVSGETALSPQLAASIQRGAQVGQGRGRRGAHRHQA